TERLPKRQSWRLVDNDLSLLARAGDLAKPPDLTVTPVPVDLARDLEAALDGAVELVTTSALLDLVSHEWLDRLVIEAAARRLPGRRNHMAAGRSSMRVGNAAFFARPIATR